VRDNERRVIDGEPVRGEPFAGDADDASA